MKRVRKHRLLPISLLTLLWMEDRFKAPNLLWNLGDNFFCPTVVGYPKSAPCRRNYNSSADQPFLAFLSRSLQVRISARPGLFWTPAPSVINAGNGTGTA